MKVFSTILIFSLIFSLVAFSFCAAQVEVENDDVDVPRVEEEAEEWAGAEEVEREPEAEEADHRDVADVEDYVIMNQQLAVTAIFPNNQDSVLTPTIPTELLIGLKNRGNSPVQLIAAQSHLHYHQMWHYYIENYTAARLNSVVKPGEQVTISYWFALHPMLEVGPYYFSSRIYFRTEDGTNFSQFVLNSTINVSEFVTENDFYSYLFVFAVIGALLAAVYYGLKARFGRKSARRISRDSNPSLENDDWLENTAYKKKKN